MNREDEEKYLDTWSDVCLICNEHTERKDRRIVSAIVPLDNLPEHAASEVTRYFMCCSSCKDSKVLV